MAEGLLESLAGSKFKSFSAGVNPENAVHPLAIKVMEEINIDITGNKPKCLTKFLGKEQLDWVVIVCNKAKTTCPKSWPYLLDSRRLYWPFDDPAKAEGGKELKLRKFREIRDQIRSELSFWLEHVRQMPELVAV